MANSAGGPFIQTTMSATCDENFFDETCPYSVSSYFYRVEFQQRGAPHIHCLLWLEDTEGNPAPTFWNSGSEDKNCETKTRMKNIEDIANMLVFNKYSVNFIFHQFFR